MRRAATLGFLFSLAILGALYMMQSEHARKAAEHARAAGEVFTVKYDLLKLARAEHEQFLHYGRYVSLEDLQEQANINCSARSYTCEADVHEDGFRITAVYRGPANSGWPRRISIDDKFELQTEE